MRNTYFLSDEVFSDLLWKFGNHVRGRSECDIENKLNANTFRRHLRMRIETKIVRINLSMPDLFL